MWGRLAASPAISCDSRFNSWQIMGSLLALSKKTSNLSIYINVECTVNNSVTHSVMTVSIEKWSIKMAAPQQMV